MQLIRRTGAAVIFGLLGGLACADEPTPFTQPAISVPDGYTIELAAAPPLVEHPLMAGFDDRGRLYIAENAGVNMQRAELEEKLPNYVSRLEDTNGDGRFDKRTVFADKLTFPQGALWHDGWLYVASSGAIWRFQDKDDDGVAEVREKIVGSFGYTGNAADVHGCFLGPEGRIWWCEGRHGHDIADAAGKPVSKGKAARIFSCRPDGSDVQVHCGGGMDNPVEIDWTDEGEMLGTVNILYHKRGDCLVHWMHGGVYPRHDQPQVVGEFRRTGELLDAVHDYGHVAVSGTCRIRGVGFQPARPLASSGPTFLVTQFNTHKVVQTSLTRDGATFRAETSDFLQAASDDFHPTDVLEDADGSLLVIDTGGWFRIGCPTSQIAKPNILGAIYRVRRTEAPKVEDPRGQIIEWNKLEGTQLVNLLGDPRPAVRERAIATLARQGDTAIPYLSKALASKDPAMRRNAIWTLTRIGTPKAQGSVRLLGLADKDPSVLAAAIASAGVTRDAACVEDLCQLLTASETPPQLARQAATSLGQIGDAQAAAPILQRQHSDTDRVLEHALIFALIEIADRDATAPALADESPRVRRAALIALDQMPDGNLTREEVAALLDTTDQPLIAAALDVISRRAGWSDELVTMAGKLLAQKELSESEQAILSGALVGMAKTDEVQALIGAKLAASETPDVTKVLLLDVVNRSAIQPRPEAWNKSLLAILTGNRDAISVKLEAMDLAGAAGNLEMDAALLTICREPAQPIELRMRALAAAASRMDGLSSDEISLIREGLGADAPSTVRLAAAQALGAIHLTPSQRAQNVDLVATAGPFEIRGILAAFATETDVEVGRALLRAVARAPGRSTLNQFEIARLSRQFSRDEETRSIVSELMSALPAIDSPGNMSAIEENLPTGGVDSGKLVFHGRKAACGSCHRVESEGGKIGPDLSKVGERRNQRDLLEALIVPSASIARGYESQVLRTADGRTLTGLVVRETAESLFLRTNDQREVRLRRSEIEEQKPSDLSIMPAGLENTMSRQELADLLAYLRSLK